MGKGEDELGVENLPHACYRLLKNRGLSLSVHFYMILPATLHRPNTMVNVDKIRGFRPPHVWMKPFVLLPIIDVKARIVVFCTPATGTPITTKATGLTREDRRVVPCSPAGVLYSHHRTYVT